MPFTFNFGNFGGFNPGGSNPGGYQTGEGQPDFKSDRSHVVL